MPWALQAREDTATGAVTAVPTNHNCCPAKCMAPQAGEEYEDTAVRELSEELGLTQQQAAAALHKLGPFRWQDRCAAGLFPQLFIKHGQGLQIAIWHAERCALGQPWAEAQCVLCAVHAHGLHSYTNHPCRYCDVWGCAFTAMLPAPGDAGSGELGVVVSLQAEEVDEGGFLPLEKVRACSLLAWLLACMMVAVGRGLVCASLA